MSKSAVLFEAIRRRILSGALPRSLALQVHGGSGQDQVCACCDERIIRADVQFELSYRAANGAQVMHPMHFLCYGVWRNAARVIEAGSARPD
jgi:hypothetical protein